MKQTARQTFERGVATVIEMGLYPSPQRINVQLKRGRVNMNNLSGRECVWRREVCKAYGVRLKGLNDEGK